MLNLNKFLLTFSATWTYVIIFFLQMMMKHNVFYIFPIWIICLFILLTALMVYIPLSIIHKKTDDYMRRAKLIELSDNSFVPTYLGYFFIAMNTDSPWVMGAMYVVIFAFLYFAGVEYFNPIFLFYGYHIYKVESDNGVQNIMILKSSSIIRSSGDLVNIPVYRINNLTYIGTVEEL
ncbi:hypothetical protein [Fructobacillus cardui]|uniref:hypothetical protein n=1 Tax=Fructobacillus cardui TaxID=2893170 RepID=UPI002DA028A2|nr:hypothetical protein R53653_IHELHDKM_01417 [Fructobacillus cardui]